VSYGNTALAEIVPEIVPASSENPPRIVDGTRTDSADRNAAVLFVNKDGGK
jgi:hypothetical protein